MLNWMQQPFFWILVSLAAWAIASRWRRIGAEATGLLRLTAILPLAIWGSSALFHAASGEPYRPGNLFWVCAFLLGLYSFTPACQAFLPRRLWTLSSARGFHFPAWYQCAALILWGTLIAWTQFSHMNHGAHWTVPVIAWAVGLYTMLRHLFSSSSDENKDTAFLESAPFTTGSVSLEAEEESSPSDAFGFGERAARWGLCVIVVIAAGLYLILPEHFPTDVHGDEGEIAFQAIEIRDSGNWNPFIPGWFGIPRLFYLLPGWGMWMLGDNLSGLRWSVGLVGVASVAMVYFAARRLLFPSPALMATFLFAVSSFFIHFSRVGNGFNQAAFFYAAVFYCLVRGLQERNLHWLAWTGTVCAVAWLSYQANQLLAPLVIASLGVLWLQRTLTSSETVKAGVVFLISFWVAFSPMVGAYWNEAHLALGRMKALSVIDAQDGESRFAYVWRQSIEALYAPLTVPDYGPFLRNLQYGGMMDPLPGLLLAASLLVFAARLWHPGAILPLLWVGATLFIGGAITESTPNYQRVIGAFPFLALMATPALYGLCARAVEAWKWRIRGRVVFIALIAALLFVMCKHRYFHQIMGTPQLHDGSTRVARYLQNLGPHTYIYFIGHPYFSMRYGNIRLIAPDANGQDILEPEALFRSRPEDRGSVAFVLIRDNSVYIDALRQLYPGGREIVHTSDSGRILFVAYEVNL